MLKIIALLSGASAFFIGPALAQEPAVPSPNPNAVSYVFDITRDGDKIGVDTLDISKDGDITTVKIGTHISVTAAFIEVYHFDHSGVETWNGNHFVSYKAKTDANGKKYSIAATADAGGKMNLTVNGQTTELSQLVLPATFWNSDFVTAAQMIDADKGALLSVQVADLGDEAIEQNGVQVQARHYRITGQLVRDIWLVNNMPVRIQLRGSDNSLIVSDLRPSDIKPQQ